MGIRSDEDDKSLQLHFGTNYHVVPVPTLPDFNTVHKANSATVSDYRTVPDCQLDPAADDKPVYYVQM